ncbi:MAG: class I SAM-dependent methyltransferase [Chitinispirillia bacterium]|jgi:2-polyprenyl-3-methyl-5-hydroxy-6-metoxy-1,4-benzoquinol methylase
MYEKLKEINSKPHPFQFYTADELWTNEHTSKKMLGYHLNETVDLSSRNKNFINRSVKWIVSHFDIGRNSKIADFGCGPGLYTTRIAEHKADVTGIDFSIRSIQYARKISQQKGLKINYICQNYLEYETDDNFDLIIMIFCDFCALSPNQRKILLCKFNKFLKPDGLILLDVHSLNKFNYRSEVSKYEFNLLNNFWSPDNYYGFLNTFKYEKEKITLDKYTVIEKSRTRVIYNWLQYFNRDSLKKEFEVNGFSAKEFYSDVSGTPFYRKSPDLAIVAQKK